MKFICQGQDLAIALTRVSRAISSKKASPILECIKVVAIDDTIKIIATDMDLAIEKRIKADIFEEGEILIPAKNFVEFVCKVANCELELTTNNNMLEMKYGTNLCYFTYLPTSEFPPIDDIDTRYVLTMDTNELKKIINQVNYAVSTDDFRPILKGCNINVADRKLNCVALNGQRMSIVQNYEVDFDESFDITVPSKSLSEIVKILENEEGNIDIKISENKIMIDLIHTKLITRLLVGDYINYRNILMNDYCIHVTCNIKQLKESLERAMLFSKNDKNIATLFDVKEEVMVIVAQGGSVGYIEEYVPIIRDGKDVTIKLNTKYVLDFLNAVTEENVVIHIKNTNSSCILEPQGNSNYFNYILPVRS